MLKTNGSIFTNSTLCLEHCYDYHYDFIYWNWMFWYWSIFAYCCILFWFRNYHYKKNVVILAFLDPCCCQVSITVIHSPLVTLSSHLLIKSFGFLILFLDISLKPTVHGMHGNFLPTLRGNSKYQGHAMHSRKTSLLTCHRFHIKLVK